MRHPSTTTPATILLATLALTGCANSATNNTAITSKPIKVAFKSPAIPTHTIPPRYTCDGQNISPPLEWGTIPGDTSELVFAAVAIAPITSKAHYTATIEWALSGINPALHKLNAGQIPTKAHIGLSDNHTRHYNICPPNHQTTKYQFMLYSVPANAKIAPQFADQPILAALSQPNTPITATAEGAFLTHYTRTHTHNGG
jgi:phosphatidylethanolamine-binding protein (PEBP) family uncharacterized protein